MISQAAISGDISYLFNKDKCMDGTVISPIKNEKHNLFDIKGIDVVFNYSKMDVEKNKEQWQEEINKNFKKYNQDICENKKNCQIKDSKNLKFYNNYNIEHSLYLSIPASIDKLKETLQNNKITVVEEKIAEKISTKERKIIVEEIFPRDKNGKKNELKSFEKTSDYIDYLQLYHGQVALKVFQINAEKTGKNNTHLLYTCSFSLPSNDDDVSFAQKHKLMYYKNNKK